MYYIIILFKKDLKNILLYTCTMHTTCSKPIIINEQPRLFVSVAGNVFITKRNCTVLTITCRASPIFFPSSNFWVSWLSWTWLSLRSPCGMLYVEVAAITANNRFDYSRQLTSLSYNESSTNKNFLKKRKTYVEVTPQTAYLLNTTVLNFWQISI